MSQQTVEKNRYELVGVEDSDADLIEEIYFSTRCAEFEMLGWEAAALRQFLKMQCDFQQQSYRMQFPAAEYLMILFENEKIGRLIIDIAANEMRLVDIAILPEYRNRGIGTEIIENLYHRARAENLPLTLQVLKTNQAAFRLYQKTGFVVTDENAIYFSMERK